MVIEKFLNELNEEIGFKFGTPWRYSDKSLGVVVPILKIGTIEERDYLTFEEAKDQGMSIKDTGRIDRIIIESSIGKPIFIRSGTAFKSLGTQPRAVETSVIIIPQEEKITEKIKIRQEIPVRCIHASMPISANTKFEYGGDVPIEVRSALLSKSGQSETWQAVGHATNRFMSARASPSSHHFASPRINRLNRDNLVGAMEEVDKFTDNIDEILKKVPLFEDQVGAFFLDIKDVVGMEMFDYPKSWEAIHKEVEKRLGESVTKEEDQSFFKPDYEKVKPLIFTFLKKLIEGEKTEIFKDDITATISIKGDGIIGEATTINDKVIHLIGLKIDKKVGQKQVSTNREIINREDRIRNNILF